MKLMADASIDSGGGTIVINIVPFGLTIGAIAVIAGTMMLLISFSLLLVKAFTQTVNQAVERTKYSTLLFAFGLLVVGALGYRCVCGSR